MNIIQQFKLISIKDGHLKASYEEHNPAFDDTHLITYENRAGIHPDLCGSLQRLAAHVRRLVGLPPAQPLFVSGYYRQNAGNAQLLTIYAHCGAEGPAEEEKRRPAHLSARLYIGRDEYAATEQLLTHLSLCEREAVAYIVEGKTFGCDKAVSFEEEDLWVFSQPAGQC